MEGKRRNHREGRRAEIGDAARLEAFALTYVARYSTTRARLIDYLRRKLRAANAEHLDPDASRIADKMVGLGYIDDTAFAEMKTSSLARRGYGPARIRTALQNSGIERDLAQQTSGSVDAEEAARAFADRRRFSAFGPDADGRKRYEKALAAMIRAGHSFDMARHILHERSQSCD